MKPARFLLAGLLVVFSARLVVGSDKQHTGSRPNGEYWRALSKPERSQLVIGMFVGLGMGASYGDLSDEVLRKVRPRMTFDQIVSAFDSFYSEPLNRPIPIESAWIVSATRDAEVSEETIAKLVGDLRAVSTGKAPASTQPPPTKHPEVYDIALNHADRSAEFRKAFGTEPEFTNERANAWALGPDQGDAYVFIDVSGSSATGRLNGHAKRSGGRWVYDDLQVLVIGSGEIIDLLKDTKE